MRKVLLVLLASFTLLQAKTLGVNERLGESIDLNLTFINEKSEKVSLKELMSGLPTIITMNYFRCPGICTPQLEGLSQTLGVLNLAENTDYKVVTVSFAEDETPALAAAKRKNHLASIQRDYIADAWHFVVGENNSSHILSKQLGFGFEKVIDETTGRADYTHAASLMIVSPEGKITRYLNGVDQLPFDVKMALIEASDGRVGPTIAKALEYCFSYDPQGKKYVFVWEKVAAVIMLALVFGFFIYLVKTGRKEDHQNKGENDE
jgi:protein SCO1